MKKILALLFALMTVLGLTGTGVAATLTPTSTQDIGLIFVPDDVSFGNKVTGGTISSGAGLVVDSYSFTVDDIASFASSATSVSVRGTGAFTSFNTYLFGPGSVATPDTSTALASNIGSLVFGAWMSVLEFSPLDFDAGYRLFVTGNKGDGSAAYGGNISIEPAAPVPEPEIYAMMAAGLGLMAFVVRRRKIFDDAMI